MSEIIHFVFFILYQITQAGLPGGFFLSILIFTIKAAQDFLFVLHLKDDNNSLLASENFFAVENVKGGVISAASDTFFSFWLFEQDF